MAVVRNLVRRWQAAVRRGDERRAASFGGSLRMLARERTLIATAFSEPAQDLTRPTTTATRTDDGWRIDGRKIFCTMSPAASVLFTAVSFRDAYGSERYEYARVPRDAAGVVIHDDWDALGMRASGSHSITFDGVRLPEPALRGGFAAGDASAYMEANLAAGLFHAAASLGIAEGAHRTASEMLARRPGAQHDARTRTLTAENAIGLSAARATLSGAAALVDEFDEPPVGELEPVFAEVQAAKAFINDEATLVVDRALSLLGRGGLSERSPARARIPRRARGNVRAPTGNQPSVRLRRDHGPRTRALLALAVPSRRRDDGGHGGGDPGSGRLRGTPNTSNCCWSTHPDIAWPWPAEHSLELSAEMGRFDRRRLIARG